MNYLLIVLLISCGIIMPAPTLSIPQQAESISAGKLSEGNEIFIQKVIAETECPNTTIEFRKPTRELIELAPVYIFGSYVPAYNYWYLNESWFNGLSDSAKQFYLGQQLIATKPAEFMDRLPNIIVWILELSILVGIFLYLRKRQSFGKYTLTTSKRIGLSVVGMFLSALPIEYVEQKLFVPTTTNILLKHDVSVVEKLNCIDGAIEFLKNQQATITPLYEHDKVYWKSLYEALPERIAQLEQIKKING